MKKKILIIITLVIALAIFASLSYVFLVPKTTKTIENSGANPNAVELKSFRGVLADVLDGIKEEAAEIEEKIGEAVTGPFTESKNEATEDSQPASSGENNFTFAILGDTQYFKAGNPNGNFQKAMANITRLNPDLVFAVGDLIGSCDGDNKCSKKYSDWKQYSGFSFAQNLCHAGQSRPHRR